MIRKEIWANSQLVERWEPDDVGSKWTIYDSSDKLLRTQPYIPSEVAETAKELAEVAKNQDWEDFKVAIDALPGADPLKSPFLKLIEVLKHRQDWL